MIAVACTQKKKKRNHPTLRQRKYQPYRQKLKAGLAALIGGACA